MILYDRFAFDSFRCCPPCKCSKTLFLFINCDCFAYNRKNTIYGIKIWSRTDVWRRWHTKVFSWFLLLALAWSLTTSIRPPFWAFVNWKTLRSQWKSEAKKQSKTKSEMWKRNKIKRENLCQRLRAYSPVSFSARNENKNMKLSHFLRAFLCFIYFFQPLASNNSFCNFNKVIKR